MSKPDHIDIAQPVTVPDTMPDVAGSANPQPGSTLQWVGMQGIALPLRVDLDAEHPLSLAARASAWVNLPAANARGIHMSRLYALLVDVAEHEALTPCALRKLLRGMLDSHAKLSDQARVRFEFELPVRRAALKSGRSGWKSYPLHVDARMHRAHGHCHVELGCRVEYSSTCPASAALARQLIQQRFEADFDPATPLQHVAVTNWLGSDQGICASPHSQRSAAEVKVRLQAGLELPWHGLIDSIEAALMTPVQTAVKREDEQEFARLNGEHPMFCEDAARSIHAALDADDRFEDFHIHVAHFESLHAHDAVAVAVKGITPGYGSE